jgi:hypothetical protein
LCGGEESDVARKETIKEIREREREGHQRKFHRSRPARGRNRLKGCSHIVRGRSKREVAEERGKGGEGEERQKNNKNKERERGETFRFRLQRCIGHSWISDPRERERETQKERRREERERERERERICGLFRNHSKRSKKSVTWRCTVGERAYQK